ncbi:MULTISPECIES: acyl-CoA thioesterase [Paraburkholderia]|uniref:Thioesterase n=1 Tax=Paraburkholderia podalyriae TaxID=1938811 RepID=A0ABR7PZK3_9BURK|nr:acyl-CoA thioesterase [Paraburkholderia podalyriae]MBC8751688.1 thioesterase [Paraburkholderia podalyriae]
MSVAQESRPVGALDTFRGVVYPSQSDAMGHMTVQYYVAAFDQAMWHTVVELGYDPEWRSTKRQGWADVRYEIDFRGELRVGDLFRVESRVLRCGHTSLRTQHSLLALTGNVAADVLMTSVYFDLSSRKSIPLPEVVRRRAEDLFPSEGAEGCANP